MNAARLVEITAPRSCLIHLEVNGGHWLEVDLGTVAASLSRDRASALIEALVEARPEVALTLLRAFAPRVRGMDDLVALQTALLAFDEEVAFEDRRGEPRTHKATKMVRI